VEAFNLALEHGCDGFEFDVRYTQDDRAVICHNPFTGEGVSTATCSLNLLCLAPTR